MADNVTLNTGSGGDTIAADDIGDVKHQKVKVEYGADGSATEVSPTSPLPTIEAGNVPVVYNTCSSKQVYSTINKGAYNAVKLRAEVPNEAQQHKTTLIGTVQSDQIIGQIFKASTDNITSIDLVLESAPAESNIDTFETYDNSTELQSEWILGGAGTNEATLEETVVYTGSTKSMRMSLAAADTWINTISSTDMSSGAILHFHLRSTETSNKGAVQVTLGDGAETSTYNITVTQENTWLSFSIPTSAFTGDANLSGITKVGFAVTNTDPGDYVYIDSLTYTNEPGSVELKLWDFGDTLPTLGEWNLAVSGTQYTTLGDYQIHGEVHSSVTLQMLGGQRYYNCTEFSAGPAPSYGANATLTEDNYYAITMHYIDDDVKVYGITGATDFYANGYAFAAEDTSAAISGLGTNAQACFVIYSNEDVYYKGLSRVLLTSDNVAASPGVNSTCNIQLNDSSSADYFYVIGKADRSPGTVSVSFDKPYYAPKGSVLGCQYSDDYSDDVYQMTFNACYYYQPIDHNIVIS